MAGKSTISITFKLDGDSKGFKDLAKDAEGLRTVISNTVSEAQQLNGNVINFAALATGLKAAQQSFSQLQSGMKSLADAYAVQEVAETKLATVMSQRMNATDDEIESIKRLAAEQQKLGVIGDEVQLSGAQQIATFINEKKSLDTLIPAMNNLLAQQKGLNATTQDAVSIGNMMGKVLQGQTSALSRAGITFTEAEANVLKFGTEQERAAMLAEVITNNVGEMNARLAQTDAGKQKQLANALSDVKEKIGSMVDGALPFVTIAAQATTALTSITTLGAGIKALSTTLYASVRAFAMSTAAVVKNRVATLAAAAAEKVVQAATIAWTAVQSILNAVLTMNPVGLIVTAIGLLITAVVAAYRNCDKFREIVDRVWTAVKPLAEAIMNGLVVALEWLCEKCKVAWEWLKKILGFGGKKVEVSVDVSRSESGVDLDSAKNRYTNMPQASAQTQTGGGNTPLWNEDANTLKGIGDNIDILNNKLQEASLEEAATINRQIDLWNEKADAIRNAGRAAAEDNTPMWKEDAATLQEIDDNIDILNNKLQTASIEEAATINRQIDLWNEKADAIKNAGRVTEDNSPLWKEDAATIREISDNIRILEDQLQNATVDEAAAINKQIDLWNEKAEAIRRAGRAAEESSVSTGKALVKGWGSVESIGNSIESMTSALKGGGNAWEKICSLIDGFINIASGMSSIIGLVNLLSNASWGHVAAKTAEATAEVSTGAVIEGEAVAQESIAAAQIVTNKLLTASWEEVAAAEFMAAHAYIPFAGFGIAAGFITAMAVMVKSVGAVAAFANGGVVSGPTLALVGEYSGASNNPEVIAPLDKLRGLIKEDAPFFGEVEFRIRGRNLVGILGQENNRISRS